MHGSFLFPLIVFVIVLISKLKAAAQQPPARSTMTPPRPRAPRPPGESEEERYRRFMDAVGLPPGSTVPPPVRTRTAPGQPLLPVNPPGTGLPVPGRLKRVPPIAPPPPLQPRPQTVLRRVPPAPAPYAPAAPAPEPVKTYFESVTPAAQPSPIVQIPSRPPVLPAAAAPSPIAAGLLQRLRDPSSIRQAIVLREILGPPKAFQLS